MAINGWFVLLTNSKERRLTIIDRRKHITQSMLLQGAPQSLALLSHTALITTNNQQLHLIDLHSLHTTQTLPLQTNANHIALTGEWVLLSSPSSNFIMRFQLSTRSGLLQLRLGSSLQKMYIAKNKAWIQDPMRNLLLRIDLQQLLIINLAKNPNLDVFQNFPIPPETDWVGLSSSWLMLGSQQKRKLHFRSLQKPGTPLDINIDFTRPLQHSYINKDVIYLTHKNNETNPLPSFITRLDLNPLSNNKPWDAITLPLPFGKKNLHIINMTTWRNFLVLANRNHTLHLLDQTEPQHLRLKSTLLLPQKPLLIAPIGNLLAVMFDDFNPISKQHSLLLVDLPTFQNQPLHRNPHQLLQLNARISALLPYKHFLLMLDQQNDLLLVFDSKRKQIIARLRVGCDPSQIAIWKHKKDSFALVLNKQGETLSILPLPM